MSNGQQAPLRAPGRGPAWLALFLSLVACGLSGYVAWKTDDGTLRAKLEEIAEKARSAGEEVTDVVSNVRNRGEAESVLSWDRLASRVTVIETSLRRGEDRAANHLDNLLDDLRFLRGVTEEKTAITLTDAVIRLEEARSKMASDAEGAIEGLKKLSSDLQRRATPDKDGKTEGPGA